MSLLSFQHCLFVPKTPPAGESVVVVCTVDCVVGQVVAFILPYVNSFLGYFPGGKNCNEGDRLRETGLIQSALR